MKMYINLLYLYLWALLKAAGGTLLIIGGNYNIIRLERLSVLYLISFHYILTDIYIIFYNNNIKYHCFYNLYLIF